MNSVNLTGRLGRDPELRYTAQGTPVCNFTLASQRSFKDNEVDWIDCVVWQKQAENVAQFLKKGSRVGIHGRIQVDSYERDGEKRRSWKVVCDEVEFLDNKQD